MNLRPIFNAQADLLCLIEQKTYEVKAKQLLVDHFIADYKDLLGQQANSTNMTHIDRTRLNNQVRILHNFVIVGEAEAKALRAEINCLIHTVTGLQELTSEAVK